MPTMGWIARPVGKKFACARLSERGPLKGMLRRTTRRSRYRLMLMSAASLPAVPAAMPTAVVSPSRAIAIVPGTAIEAVGAIVVGPPPATIGPADPADLFDVGRSIGAGH